MDEEKKLAQEIDRLRKEGSRQLAEEQEAVSSRSKIRRSYFSPDEKTAGKGSPGQKWGATKSSSQGQGQLLIYLIFQFSSGSLGPQTGAVHKGKFGEDFL